MFCENCGHPIPENSNFCTYCGKKVQAALQPQPAARPIPEPIPQPIPEPAFAEPEKKPKPGKKRKKRLLIGIAAVLIVAAAAGFFGAKYLTMRQKYNEALSCLDSRRYDEAYAAFTELEDFSDAKEMAQRVLQEQYDEAMAEFENGNYETASAMFSKLDDFSDAEVMVRRAQVEQDYQELDALIAEKRFQTVCEILKERSELNPDEEESRQDAALAEEYSALETAFQEIEACEYASAADRFSGLTLLRENYLTTELLCRAKAAREENNWALMLVYLYAIEKKDPELTFASDPQTESDQIVADAYAGTLEDETRLLDAVQPEDADAQILKVTAANGFRYDEAAEMQAEGLEEEALVIYEELGDFSDAASRADSIRQKLESLEETYQDAESYYQNKEYYKARCQYESIPDYKDSNEKAAACLQPLPENGALTVGNGYAVALTIVNPDSVDSVYLKLYDKDGFTVGKIFIRAGQKATIKMNADTYSMKAGYGTEWYGEVDLFGPDGSYSQLLNGSDSTFLLESGYTYTLTLGGVSDGNVGSRSIGGADGM